MTHLRIFISSPGDVGREREIADRVLTRLQAEFHGRAWLPDLVEAVGGLALSDSGALDNIDSNKFVTLRQQLATSSGDDFWSKAARWFLADRTTRTLSPQSLLTIADNHAHDAAAAPKKSLHFDLLNSK